MKHRTKRKIYISLFVVLGLLAGLVVHGLIELWYIHLLTTDFKKFSLGFSWADWFMIHKLWSVITLLGGIVAGYYQGRYWWEIVYEQRTLDPFFRKVRKFFRLPGARS